MNQQMQRGLPAHLQQYVGANKPAVVPQRAQAELTAHMQKVMPEHLKQYAGAYVEQNVMSRPAAAAPMTGRPPIPDRLNLSHSGEVAAEQANAQFLNLFQSDRPAPPVPPGPEYGPGPQPPAASDPTSTYEFIMSPQQPKRPGLFNFGSVSTRVRIAVVAGAVILLLILFVGIKNMLAGSNTSIPNMVNVAQDQQELIHLATDGVQHAVSDSTKNFAVTAQASLMSEQRDMLTYLTNNHRKVSNKELVLKVSKSTDAQLATALSTSTYDTTFKDVMKSKLTGYRQALQQAYAQTEGPKGRALLNDDYKAAGLLLKQLGS